MLFHAARNDIIHLHTNGHNLKSWLVSLLCAGVGLLNGRRTVVSIGSGAAPEYVGAARGAVRVLIATALGLAGAVICRNERTAQALASAGGRPEKITVLAGFYGVRTGALPAVPPDIAAFLERAAPVVAALASSGPEYGIPQLIDAVERLRPRYPRLGLLLIGAGHPPAGDGGNILVTGELTHKLVLSVLQKVSVFVRPTYFDGDASSVREALALGIPVVASDTDFRPEGVVLFRRGDVDGLTTALARTLTRERVGPARPPRSEPDSFERLLAVYRQLDIHVRHNGDERRAQ
ncbi:MAG: glycosyltransferase [Gemmatimonadetes bacterium]|nr:glycosyltransferase [Gemmatimonadota bacterium]